ncbi:hypothetical protein TNCV_425201 [Trichonephila clavipes]|nr:hypothetical protein TNCV_425201 [Trichonephila clavipes]
MYEEISKTSPISYHSGSFAMPEGGTRLVPGTDYMVDALKLSNQAPGVSGESLQTCVAGVVLMEYNTSSDGQF